METLETIAQKVQICTLCPLHKNATHGVPGEGSSQAKIFFIGEAPGRNEDLQGRPFVGASGKFLTHLIEGIGLKRSDVFITSVTKHRPPENREPTPKEIQACFVYLKAQLEIIKPLIIVTLGRHALNTFLPTARISEVHGSATIAKGINNPKQIYFPIYHPASALYNPALRKTLIEDFEKLAKLLKELEK